MNEIKSTHYLLVTDVIYSDDENEQRYNTLLWWNLRHYNVTLKLRTVIKNGKPMSIMTLVTPDDRTDLVNEFNKLVNKVNGLYPMYDLVTVCSDLSVKDYKEEEAHHTQH